MANNIPVEGQILVGANVANIDANYGPWPTLQVAYNTLASRLTLAEGLTVGIQDEVTGEITEYWFQNGTELGNLIPKGNTNADVFWQEGTLSKSINGVVSQVVTAQQILADANGATQAQFQYLQQQIEAIWARLTNITLSINPTSTIVKRPSDIAIDVSVDRAASSVSYYRNNELMYTESIERTHFTYTDHFIPSSVGDITYKVEVIVGNITHVAEATLTVEDAVTSITWTGGSISPSTVPVGGTAILTKGTVTANYASGRTEDVTNSAEFVTNGDGYIDGTTYHPRSTAGPEDIFPRYGGKSATNPIMVIVTEQHLTVQIGAGRSYPEVNNFRDTGLQLTNGMHLNFDVNAGDYLFIKIDKTQRITKVTTYNPDNPMFDSPINFDDYVDDGDYVYYKKSTAYREPIDARITVYTEQN